jgi:hypothetical protein
MTALTAGIALVPLVLAAGEPGKEILYPVATVILGGLISCTLLDFFVRPALYWTFGRRVTEELAENADHDELGDTGAPLGVEEIPADESSVFSNGKPATKPGQPVGSVPQNALGEAHL